MSVESYGSTALEEAEPQIHTRVPGIVWIVLLKLDRLQRRSSYFSCTIDSTTLFGQICPSSIQKLKKASTQEGCIYVYMNDHVS